jgi:hypothetical protein
MLRVSFGARKMVSSYRNPAVGDLAVDVAALNFTGFIVKR